MKKLPTIRIAPQNKLSFTGHSLTRTTCSEQKMSRRFREERTYIHDEAYHIAGNFLREGIQELVLRLD